MLDTKIPSLNIPYLAATMLKFAIVASQIARVSSEAKYRPIWAPWMTFTSKVSLGCESAHQPVTLMSCCATALGVSEEIAALGLKGNKKKRAKRLDEDFNVSSQCNVVGLSS